jgi:hypothetical protein
MIKAVVFDFGGVVAEEGFREGLKAIGRKNGLDPRVFSRLRMSSSMRRVTFWERPGRRNIGRP